MPQKSISGNDLSKAITSDDILGKDVIDLDGEFIGVVDRVFIDSNSLEFVGISVDKGFLGKGLSIGRDYIDKVTSHALLLNIVVAFKIKGMSVFDKNGKLVGKVNNIELFGNRNRIKNLIVTKGFKKITISSDLIETIGNNVILNVLDKDLDRSNE